MYSRARAYISGKARVPVVAMYHITYSIILLFYYSFTVSSTEDLCRLIDRQYEVEIRICYIDRLGKFDYGPGHTGKNHRYTYVWKAWKVLISN